MMRGSFDKLALLDPHPWQLPVPDAAYLRSFEREPVALTEHSVHHFSRVKDFSLDQIAECVRDLTSRANPVSDHPESYLLASYLRHHSTLPVRFLMSVAAAARL